LHWNIFCTKSMLRIPMNARAEGIPNAEACLTPMSDIWWMVN
jgi:hypothetical protein